MENNPRCKHDWSCSEYSTMTKRKEVCNDRPFLYAKAKQLYPSALSFIVLEKSDSAKNAVNTDDITISFTKTVHNN